MQASEYLKLTAATDHSPDIYSEEVCFRAVAVTELTHYAFGIGTEAGEVQDILKKFIAYGKPIDNVNLKEELGDLLWYVARICAFQGYTLEEVMVTNINKLKARYGDKFTAHAALNRDLDAERKILEK